jgi:hypothetical protein
MRVATDHWWAFGEAPTAGRGALGASGKPATKLQIAATRLELPIPRCTAQASAIGIESNSATSASRYKTVIRNSA